MILIIGGAYQGKLEFAKNNYGIKDEDICDLSTGYIPDKRCYYHLEELSRKKAFAQFPDYAIIISNEIGSGVVPIAKSERIYRQEHGLLLQELSQKSEEVYRVFCGIGMKVK